MDSFSDICKNVNDVSIPVLAFYYKPMYKWAKDGFFLLYRDQKKIHFKSAFLKCLSTLCCSRFVWKGNVALRG